MAHQKTCGRVGSLLLLAVAVVGAPACEESAPSSQVLCFEQDNGDGTRLITCDNGLEVVVADGRPGRPGQSCGVIDNENGTAAVACDDGSTFIVRDGRDGASCRPVRQDSGVAIVCTDGSSAVVSDGADGSACTVSTNEAARQVEIACTDGTTATVQFGEDGQDCTVSRDEGGAINVACGDSSGTVVDGAPGTSCSVDEAADGTVTISCGDGTSEVVIEGSQRIGSILGHAYLYGLPEHDGITVRVLGTGISTRTALDGSYELDDVPNGSRTLEFSRPPFVTQTLEVPVLPGAYEADDVLLRLSRKVLDGSDSLLSNRCGDDGLLVLTGTFSIADVYADPRGGPSGFNPVVHGQLERWRDGATTVVAHEAAELLYGGGSSCAPDGSAVLVQTERIEPPFGGPPQVSWGLWREGGGLGPFDFVDSFYGAEFGADSQSLAVSGNSPVAVSGLWVVDLATGAETLLADDVYGYQYSDTGGSLYFDSDSQGLGFHAVGGSTTFDETGLVETADYLPDSDLVLYGRSPVDGTYTLTLRDVGAGSGVDLSTLATGSWRVSPNGDYIVFSERGDSDFDHLAAWDVALGARAANFPEPEVDSFWVELGASGILAWADVLGGDPESIRFWDLAAGSALDFAIDTTLIGFVAEFSPDGTYVNSRITDQDGNDRRIISDPRAGTVIYQGLTDFLGFSPDSQSYLLEPPRGGITFRSVTDDPGAPSRFLVSPMDDSGGFTFAPDGSSLVVQSSNLGTVVWHLADLSNVRLGGENDVYEWAYLNSNTVVFFGHERQQQLPSGDTFPRYDLGVHDVAAGKTWLLAERSSNYFDLLEPATEDGDTLLYYLDIDFTYPEWLDDGWFVLWPF